MNDISILHESEGNAMVQEFNEHNAITPIFRIFDEQKAMDFFKISLNFNLIGNTGMRKIFHFTCRFHLADVRCIFQSIMGIVVQVLLLE
jgi:hypothetical protein